MGERGPSPLSCAEIVSHTGLESHLNPSHTCLASLLCWDVARGMGGVLRVWDGLWELCPSAVRVTPGAPHRATVTCVSWPWAPQRHEERWHPRVYPVNDASEEKRALGRDWSHIPAPHHLPTPLLQSQPVPISLPAPQPAVCGDADGACGGGCTHCSPGTGAVCRLMEKQKKPNIKRAGGSWEQPLLTPPQSGDEFIPPRSPFLPERAGPKQS